MHENGSPSVCLVGTSPPRHCGIATFTDDLRQALTGSGSEVPAVQIALTDEGGDYAYGPQVVFEIRADEREDYSAAAEFVNGTAVDVPPFNEYGVGYVWAATG